MSKPKKVGIKDISKAAGVSLSTVSHALNGTAPISSEVRNRVLAAASELGYLAKRKAKASISSLRNIVLVAQADALPHTETNLVSWTVVSALTKACADRGIKIAPFILSTKDEDFGPLVKHVAEAQADGVVIINDDRSTLLRQLKALKIPAVLINGEDRHMQVDSVTPGNRFAAQMATNWLIEQGHSRIAHLTWRGRQTISRRRDGVLDAIQEHQLPADSVETIYAEGFRPQQGQEAITQWLQKWTANRATAIFCSADNLAMGAMAALREAGLKVPQDMSVLGFDGAALGELATPALTTVDVPFSQFGVEALNLLEQRSAHYSLNRPAHRLELGCELVIRGSVSKLN